MRYGEAYQMTVMASKFPKVYEYLNKSSYRQIDEIAASYVYSTGTPDIWAVWQKWRAECQLENWEFGIWLD